MSSTQIITNEWSTVSKKKKSKPLTNKLTSKTNSNKPLKRNNTQNEKPNKIENSADIELDDNQISEILIKINLMMEILNTYDFSRNIYQNNPGVNKSHNINKLVGLGIGIFTESPLALIQLSIFLHLSTLFHPHTTDTDATTTTTITTHKPLPMYLYDPSLTKTDIKICQALGIQLLVNRHGKYCLNELDTYLSTNDTNTTLTSTSGSAADNLPTATG